VVKKSGPHEGRATWWRSRRFPHFDRKAADQLQ
jgi:hypothetical protein